MSDWLGFKFFKDPEDYCKVDSSSNIPLIESGIDQILNTLPGERRMLPEFGSRLRRLVFEPHDDILYLELGREVATAIARWEPRVILEDVRIRAVESNEHAVAVSIRYYLKTNRRVASTLSVRVEG